MTTKKLHEKKPYDGLWPITRGTVRVGGSVPTTRRILTGLWGLDQACAGAAGEPGLPIRGGVEIYGRWETGKSTLAYFLAGRVHPTGRIVLIDLEGGAREDYLRVAVETSGFKGEIYRVEHEAKGQPRSHEEMLREGADSIRDDDVWCIILDSAAMTQPLPEREGGLDEANMGKRAQVLAKFSRRWGPWINFVKQDKLVIIVNHMLQDMGGYGKISPGGDTLKFGIHTRLWIRRKGETFGKGAFEAEIKVEKLRFGGVDKARIGRAVIVPGMGVSVELTALFDCMSLGQARRQAGTGMVQFLEEGGDWVKVAKLPTLVERVREGNVSDFASFYKILEAQ